MTMREVFSHVYDISFEVLSDCDEASDVTANHLRGAVIDHVQGLSDSEIFEAVGWRDTFEVDMSEVIEAKKRGLINE
jgi:hypothetical protein